MGGDKSGRRAWREGRAKFLKGTGAVILPVVVGGVIGTDRRLRDDEPVRYKDIEEHFKYGSSGGERGWGFQFGFGIPYWICRAREWVAVPRCSTDCCHAVPTPNLNLLMGC